MNGEQDKEDDLKAGEDVAEELDHWYAEVGDEHGVCNIHFTPRNKWINFLTSNTRRDMNTLHLPLNGGDWRTPWGRTFGDWLYLISISMKRPAFSSSLVT